MGSNAKYYLSLLQRIGYSILSIFLLVSFVFILLRIAPGDPTQKFISPELSPQLAEKVKNSFMLNMPVHEQYFHFVKNLFSGYLGVSYNYRMPVFSVIGEFLPFTAIFAVAGLSFQIFVSLLLVTFISKRRGGKTDRILHKISISVYSLPTIIVGVSLIFIFSAATGIFPSSDLKSVYFNDLNGTEKFIDIVRHMILPLLTLSIGGTLIFYNYLRENINSVYDKSFVKYLRANGSSEKIIFYRHVLPNAVGPLISVIGVELGILLGGALITETIFGLPGMGRMTVSAILSRDYPLIVGCTLVTGSFVIAANLLADIIKSRIDPRL